MIPNFNLAAGGRISNHFLAQDIKTFYDAIKHIRQLHYGRSKQRYPLNILKENKGTCSSKHACIKELAEENNIKSVKLFMCIYPMSEENTPGVGAILKRYKLEYILEAHVYIFYDEERFDFTFPYENQMKWENDILIEVEINTNQIYEYKINYHKKILFEHYKPMIR